MALLKHTLALAVLGGAMLLILFTWRHRRRSAATAAEHGLRIMYTSMRKVP